MEAFGLWFDKAWAEWFAAVSVGLFIPFEVFEILRKPTPLRSMVLAFNIVIVAYLLRVVVRRARYGYSRRGAAGHPGKR